MQRFKSLNKYIVCMDVRKELIKEAKKLFGEDLVIKDHLSLTSFYYEEEKRGCGFFWVYKKLTNKGYRVQFQKVIQTYDRTKKIGYGGYPMKYLRNMSNIQDFLKILKITRNNFTNRFSKIKKMNNSRKLHEFIE